MESDAYALTKFHGDEAAARASAARMTLRAIEYDGDTPGPDVTELDDYGQYLLSQLFLLQHTHNVGEFAGLFRVHIDYRDLLEVFADLYPVAGVRNSFKVWDAFIRWTYRQAYRKEPQPDTTAADGGTADLTS